jgi:hypothetical protein
MWALMIGTIRTLVTASVMIAALASTGHATTPEEFRNAIMIGTLARAYCTLSRDQDLALRAAVLLMLGKHFEFEGVQSKSLKAYLARADDFIRDWAAGEPAVVETGCRYAKYLADEYLANVERYRNSLEPRGG